MVIKRYKSYLLIYRDNQIIYIFDYYRRDLVRNQLSRTRFFSLSIACKSCPRPWRTLKSWRKRQRTSTPSRSSTRTETSMNPWPVLRRRTNRSAGGRWFSYTGNKCQRTDGTALRSTASPKCCSLWTYIKESDGY